jgi:hypothetical protein
LFLLANYNRKSHSYSNELERMDGSVSAYILMTTSEQFKINLKEAEFIFADEN